MRQWQGTTTGDTVRRGVTYLENLLKINPGIWHTVVKRGTLFAPKRRVELPRVRDLVEALGGTKTGAGGGYKHS